MKSERREKLTTALTAFLHLTGNLLTKIQQTKTHTNYHAKILKLLFTWAVFYFSQKQYNEDKFKVCQFDLQVKKTMSLLA